MEGTHLCHLLLPSGAGGVCSLLTGASPSPSVSQSLVSLLQFLCWLTAEWVSNLLLCKLLHSRPGPDRLTSESAMAAVLQTPLYCVLCTSVQCTVQCSVHLYRLVLTRTGPTLSKNWHNITQTRFDQIPPPRHRTAPHIGDTIINWQRTHT